MTTPFQRHAAEWRGCQRCPLGKQRQRICLARGAVPCQVLFIGEAPGASEDVIGKPFVGPAGHLLDSIIREARLRPGQYAMTNLVACFPREAKTEGVNEPPEESIKACAPRVVELVRLCRPRLIVLVGKLAVKHVSGEAQFGDVPGPCGVALCSWLHGRVMEFLELMHPAAILRMGVSQQSLAIQRCVVALSDATEDL